MFRSLLWCSALFLAPVSVFAQQQAELRIFGGINAGPDREPLDSAGGSVGFDITGPLASPLQFTAGYTFNGLGDESGTVCTPGMCRAVRVRIRLHEVLGGIRVAPTGQRITPYGSFGVGFVHASGAVAGFGGGSAFAFDEETTKFALSPAVGVNFGLSDNLGFMVDFRLVKALDIPVYVRPSAGIVFHF